MTKSTIEKMANPIGFEIGISDDLTQAELLNGFCKGLSNSIIEKHNLDTQLVCITDKLNDSSIRIILELAEFINLKEKNTNRT